MKLTLTNAALVLALTGAAHAATISIDSILDLDVTVDPNAANTLSSGSGFTVRVGVYTGPALTTTATFASINSSFTEVGSLNLGTAAVSNYNGYFGTSSAISFTDADGVGGQNIWLWVTDGANINGVYEATGALAGDFQFKADAAIPNSGSIQFGGAAFDDWAIRLGTFTTGGVNAAYGGSYVLNTANPVPEPAVALLGAFGVIGLLRRRRP
ncbi:hypothetical protein HAHE_10540 [Haloferula helveola]|uniref:PEP-CTERM protein-sorting domain-containing protein n=1 Tax=Haloferula helveola TaxID=490095 RepID=A0ABM7RBV6_9BACT|nr:hypothetical protein HAHE_10540 [Haloferula helveola]